MELSEELIKKRKLVHSSEQCSGHNSQLTKPPIHEPAPDKETSTSFSDLPIELQLDILQRLNVHEQRLLQSRVSKPWKEMLSEPCMTKSVVFPMKFLSALRRSVGFDSFTAVRDSLIANNTKMLIWDYRSEDCRHEHEGNDVHLFSDYGGVRNVKTLAIWNGIGSHLLRHLPNSVSRIILRNFVFDVWTKFGLLSLYIQKGTINVKTGNMRESVEEFTEAQLKDMFEGKPDLMAWTINGTRELTGRDAQDALESLRNEESRFKDIPDVDWITFDIAQLRKRTVLNLVGIVNRHRKYKLEDKTFLQHHKFRVVHFME